MVARGHCGMRAMLHGDAATKKEEGWWGHVQLQPPDPILGVAAACKADPDPNKVNLGVGAYRDNTGKPVVLECVKKAERQLLVSPNHNHEYIPQTGLPEFVKVAKELAFGPNGESVDHQKVATVQSLSGTGALRLAAAFLKKYYAPGASVFVPNPTWGNHLTVFGHAGFDSVKRYRYYNSSTNLLDFDKMVEDIENAPSGSVILLHACAHNPTGMDPTPEQWNIISQTVKARKHIVVFDCAYQGFASGDPVLDVAPLRLFLRDGHQFLMCQSFAKNFGLYGERVGTVSVVCHNPTVAKNVESQLGLIVRAMYSSPALFGARIVHSVLSDVSLRKEWLGEVRGMATRISGMRSALVTQLAEAGSIRDWSHVTRQIGMFSYTGLTEKQVKRMTEKHHVYLTKDGRISMAGLNTGNVKRVAKAIHEVTTANY